MIKNIMRRYLFLVTLCRSLKVAKGALYTDANISSNNFTDPCLYPFVNGTNSTNGTVFETSNWTLFDVYCNETIEPSVDSSTSDPSEIGPEEMTENTASPSSTTLLQSPPITSLGISRPTQAPLGAKLETNTPPERPTETPAGGSTATSKTTESPGAGTAVILTTKPTESPTGGTNVPTGSTTQMPTDGTIAQPPTLKPTESPSGGTVSPSPTLRPTERPPAATGNHTSRPTETPTLTSSRPADISFPGQSPESPSANVPEEMCSLCLDGSKVKEPDNILFFSDGRSCGDWENDLLEFLAWDYSCAELYFVATGPSVDMGTYCSCPGQEGSTRGCTLCPNRDGVEAVNPYEQVAGGSFCYEIANYARAIKDENLCLEVQADYAYDCCRHEMEYPTYVPTSHEFQCTLCRDQVSTVKDPDAELFFDDGRSCGDWENDFLDLTAGDACDELYYLAGGPSVDIGTYCSCPGEEGSAGTCQLCPNESGVEAVNPSEQLAGGLFCSDIANYARSIVSDEALCLEIQTAWGEDCCTENIESTYPTPPRKNNTDAPSASPTPSSSTNVPSTLSPSLGPTTPSNSPTPSSTNEESTLSPSLGPTTLSNSPTPSSSTSITSTLPPSFGPTTPSNSPTSSSTNVPSPLSPSLGPTTPSESPTPSSSTHVPSTLSPSLRSTTPPNNPSIPSSTNVPSTLSPSSGPI